MTPDPSADAKISCRTPTPGKAPVNIPAWKYALISRAILKVVPARGAGVDFQDLPALVAGVLSAEQRRELGSISWHTTVVKLNMEVTGEIRRIKDSSPQRLLKCPTVHRD